MNDVLRKHLLHLVEDCRAVSRAATNILRADSGVSDRPGDLEDAIGGLAHTVDVLTLRECGVSVARIAIARAEKRRAMMQAAAEAVPQYDFIHDTAKAEA